jgi:hypothetical protein
MCLSYCVVPCLDQNTGVNVSELLCGRRVQKWRLHYPWITASIRRPPFWSTLLYAFPENGLVVILLPAILVNRFRHSLRKAWTWAWASGRCAFGLSILYFYCWLYRWMLQFDHSPREIYVWKIHIWKDMFLTKLPLRLYLNYFSYKVVIFIHIQEKGRSEWWSPYAGSDSRIV